LLTLFLAVAFIDRKQDFPGWVAGIPVLATLAVLEVGAAAPRSWILTRFLNLPPLQYLGSISYALYLWHWPVLMIGRQLFSANLVWSRSVCVVFSVLLAAITHVIIENPIRFNRYFKKRSLLSLGFAAMFMAISIGGFAAWRIDLSRSAQFRKFSKALHDVPSLYASGCRADDSDSQPKMCNFGQLSNPSSTVVLFGDSHAAQWFPAVKDIAERKHWKLVTIIKSSCSPMNIPADNPNNRHAVYTCEEWRMRAIDEIRRMHPQIVLMSSATTYLKRDVSELIDPAQWEQGSRDTFLSVAQLGTNVVFLRDTPHTDYDIPLCLAQSEYDGRTTCPPLIRSKVLNSDIYQAQVRSAGEIANVRFVDLSDYICGPDTCATAQDGVILYRDSNHLSATYVETLSRVLEKQLG